MICMNVLSKFLRPSTNVYDKKKEPKVAYILAVFFFFFFLLPNLFWEDIITLFDLL